MAKKLCHSQLFYFLPTQTLQCTSHGNCKTHLCKPQLVKYFMAEAIKRAHKDQYIILISHKFHCLCIKQRIQFKYLLRFIKYYTQILLACLYFYSLPANIVLNQQALVVPRAMFPLIF